MKRIVSIIIILCLTLLLVSCFNKRNNSSTTSTTKIPGNNDDIPEEFIDKIYDGIDPVFNESLGYYNEMPSVIQVGTKRYLFYTRNTKSFSNNDSIAVRVGTYKGGKWLYDDPKTIILPSENGWDSANVFAPDVVKGKFAYNNETYNYLMAYSGTSISGRKNSQIGLAVAKEPDGEWIKVGNEPIVKFDSSQWEPTGVVKYKGAYEPSLISFDREGKVYLFYTEYESLNNSYVLELDCSNLNSIIKGGRKVVETTGLNDLGATNPQLYNADYVYDQDTDKFIAVREASVTVTTEPKVADQLELVISSADIIRVIEHEWQENSNYKIWWKGISNRNKINADNTMDFDLDRVNGYSRIFSGCIVSDEYGYILEYGSLEIYFTSQALYNDDRFDNPETDYLFSQMIHSITIKY